MSFALPSIKPKPSSPNEAILEDSTDVGVPTLLTSGLAGREIDADLHPLISSERNYHKNRDAMNMAILRNTQGMHAPLRLNMELLAVKKVGRLPFLPSSNAMHDALTGRDLEVWPEDLYNTAEFREMAGQPHAVVEKSLGIL
ncbi:hypothetical protein PPYR_07627 [Photinus pyralis]|uniref:Proteasome maturation protein n=1 Tax=Photinus pyralis TaxID=7054 RepID=A0A1Y1K784_PHOPY|nr:proteasome maturation protein-like [Photinus pyralis]XP_031340265.1 proteasome maturation protein-like [Photinus pyralis]KAB0799737.1 hypothetical protein PPYR_07617 [Photinus pyralis]KAB0799747.1 hypothetical protein PPYR_07627 [Photinus pyralis]